MSNNQFENDIFKYLNFEPCRSPPHSIGELYELSREEVSEFLGENSAGPSTAGRENSVGPSTEGFKNSEASSSTDAASSKLVTRPALFPDKRSVHGSATPSQSTYLSPATLGWIHPIAHPTLYPTCDLPEGTVTANRSGSKDIELEF